MSSAGFEGRLIGPEDSDYEAARTVYNAMIDKRPALIARCASLGDVSRTIAFARDHDLLIAIRGGGHNGAGLGTCDDGVVIDLSLLKEIQVDPAARTVRVGGGCTWGEVDQATGEHGLATPSGIISTTGVGGLTLGGGIGHLTRKCGLSDRQPPRGRAGTRERRARARQRRGAPGSLLGDPGRRRQLRRRHVVPVPVARGRHCGRRPDVLAGRARRRRPFGIPRVPAGCSARAQRLLRLPHRAAGTPVPRGDPSAQGLRGGLVLRRLGGGRSRGDGTPARRSARAPDARRRTNASRGAPGRLRRPLPAGRPVVLARRFRQGDPGRGRSDPRPLRRRHADDEVDDAHVPDRRRRPRPGEFRYGLEPIETRAGDRSSPASTPIRRTSTRSGSGVSTTSRPCTPTRPAGRT